MPLDTGKEYYFREGCYIIEQLQQPQDSDLSIARARVLPGETTAWHALQNIVERYYILSGSGLVDVGDELSQRVSTGDVVLIPAGVSQRITNTGDEDLIFLALCTPPFVASAYREIAE